MTAEIYPFLTFKNAKEAMNYYVQEFGASVVSRFPLTSEQANNLGLEPEDLDDTTAYGEMEIAGHLIMCSDATMLAPQASSIVSLMLDFHGDSNAAKELFDHLAASDQQKVTLPFGPHQFRDELGMIVDAYGITWMISAGHPEED